MRWRACLSLVVLLVAAGPANAQPAIDARTDELLRAMSRTLTAAPQLSFRVVSIEGLVDDDTGKVVHVSSARTIDLARPDRLRVDETADFARHTAWFAAGRLTIFDAAANEYAAVDTPRTVDAMLDHVFKRYGLVMPADDLVLADPYASLSAAVVEGHHLGTATVSGRACEHLAFRNESVDWQLWIEEQDEQALPVQVVITYKNEPGDPQFTARFSDWDLAAVHPAGHFDPALPKDAVRIELETLVDQNDEERGAR